MNPIMERIDDLAVRIKVNGFSWRSDGERIAYLCETALLMAPPEADIQAFLTTKLMELNYLYGWHANVDMLKAFVYLFMMTYVPTQEPDKGLVYGAPVAYIAAQAAADQLGYNSRS